jgi:lysophospholipase
MHHRGKSAPGQRQAPITPIPTMTSVLDHMTCPDGTRIRYGIWPVSPLSFKADLLLLNGRTEFMEKYAETIGELNGRGFTVFSFDWRGQGLSSRALANRHKGHVEDFSQYLADLDRFVAQVVCLRRQGSLIALAHSMGGHLLLRYLHEHPKMVDRAVLSAPMIDIATFPLPRILARWLVQWGQNFGWEKRFAPGSGNWSLSPAQFPGNRLTSDRGRFMDEIRAVSQNPELALGGVTYQWLAASFRSIALLAAPGYPEGIQTPVLMLSAGADQVVCNRAQKALARRLPHCRFAAIPGSRHEILKERDAIRAVFWTLFDRFV